MVCHDTLFFEETESTGMNNCGLSNEVVTCLVTSSTVERQTQFLGSHEVVSDKGLPLLLVVIVITTSSRTVTFLLVASETH